VDVIVPPIPPIVCTLTPEDLHARRSGLLAQLQSRVQDREPLTDGIRLTFDSTPDVLSTIARAVEAERHCCRFLRFVLTIAPAGGPIVLELTGPPGTAEFLAGLFEE
jgi:hypothetical protein